MDKGGLQKQTWVTALRLTDAFSKQMAKPGPEGDCLHDP
jgi:hypothetical protein